jgi:hypothetical protein
MSGKDISRKKMLNELKQFVKDNPKLVRMNKTSNPNLFVLKYARAVFYNNAWNEFLENCRGTIVDDEFNIVSLPFTKIYNFGIEERAPKWSGDTEVEYVRKVNGFMIACTWHENDLLWSTTGSIGSDFVGYAKEIFNGFTEQQREIFRGMLQRSPSFTFMFECVHPSDPHIIPEETGLYLLGCREKKFESPVYYTPVHTIWEDAGIKTIPVQYGTVADVIREAKTCTHEGFVMYRLNDEGIQESTKIKSPFYLMNKLFARGNTDRLLDGKAKSILDEEYYPLIDHIASNRESFKLMNEQERLGFTRKFIEEIL